MPLARILTAFPERADSLARQLRDQGYNVEFLSPEKAGMLRADLEIDFEICDQNVVLRRAAELANKLHADIAVSPDALPANLEASDIYVSESEIKEVASHLPDAYVESFLAQGERTGQIQNLEHSEHMVALPPDMLASPTIQPQPMAHAQEANFETAHAEPMQSQSAEPMRAEEPVRHVDVPVFPDPERHAEGTFGFETHASHINDHPVAQTGAAPGPVIHTPPEPVTPAAPVAPKDEWMERASALSSAAFAAGKEKSANLWASARRFSNDCAEWINVRMAAAQEKRQQRQIEAQKQQEIARARAEELEIARDAAAVRLQELLRERGGLTDQQPVPPSAGPVPAYRRNEPPVAPGFNNAPVAQGFNNAPAAQGFSSSMNGNSVNGSAAGPGRFERFAAGFERFKQVVVTRKYGQQWEAVLMGVAAACALFVVGVAVNSFRPHPALSNTITQPSSASPAPVAARATSGSQPYNGVTVKAGSPGVTLLPSPARAGTTGSAPVATNKPSPKESDVTVRHFGNTARPTSRHSDGSIAQDVTIRHFTQQPKPAAHNSADGVKRFSDLD